MPPHTLKALIASGLVLPVVLFVFLAVAGGGHQAQMQSCDTAGLLYNPVDAKTGSSPTFKEPDQIKHAKMIIGIGLSRKLSTRDIKIALMVAMQESNLHNLAYGDRDSIGIYQQRPSQGWGTADQIMNPVYSINKFYDALEQVKNRDSQGLFEVAISVQRPDRQAYASRWGLWDKPANAFLVGVTIGDTVDLVDIASPESGCSENSGDVETAVLAALSQVGSVYHWQTNTGELFDAAEFTQWAYAQSGTTIPSTAPKQLKAGPAVKTPGKGTEKEWESTLQRGDLLYWSDPLGLTASRVSMYIGNGQMIVAPSAKATVEIVDFRLDAVLSEFLGATRPIDSFKGGGKHSGWQWPLKETVITSPFGMRVQPVLGIYRLHNGTDFAAAMGTPVYAAKSGTVTYVGDFGGGGNAVTIDHGGGVETSYLHLSAFNTRVGEKVSAGDRIASSGNSGGISTGPHLHLMLNIDGIGTDPIVYLKQFGLVP